MSQPPSPKPRSRTARPVSIDFSQDLSESRLYNMLPSVVQSRLPRLPSLRKSVSTYTLRSSPPSPRSRSGTSSPETAYYGTVVVRDSRNDDMDDTTSLSLDTATTVSVSEDDDLAPPKKQLRRPNEPTEAKTGIAWRIAYQGLSLLGLAMEESSMISEDGQMGNASFARQLYLHSVTYLLRALPADLTTEEQLSIRSALPQTVTAPLHVQVNPPCSGQDAFQGGFRPNHPPSLLHRTVASMILNLFILIHFLLPYLKAFLAQAYAYERKHRISERILSQSREMTDSWGKRSASVAEVVSGMAEGRVGKVLGETGAWIVDEIVGGVNEGIGGGVAVFGPARKELAAQYQM